MHTLLNLMWFFSGRFKESFRWGFSGIAKFRKLTGIPVGLQHLKFATMIMRPFGRKVVHKITFGTVILNAYWIISDGLSHTIAALLKGMWLCITIIGIPYGLQWFKFAGLALLPFGSKVVRINEPPKAPKSKLDKARILFEELEEAARLEEELLHTAV